MTVFTSTRTYTSVFTLGEQITQEYPVLQPAYNKMTAFAEQHSDKLKRENILFTPTNDKGNYSLLRMQWSEILPQIARRREIPVKETKEISDLLPDTL